MSSNSSPISQEEARSYSKSPRIPDADVMVETYPPPCGISGLNQVEVIR